MLCFVNSFKKAYEELKDKDKALKKINLDFESFSDEENLIEQYKEFFSLHEFNLFVEGYLKSNNLTEFNENFYKNMNDDSREERTKTLIMDFFFESLIICVLGLITSLYNAYLYVMMFTSIQMFIIICTSKDIFKEDLESDLLIYFYLYYIYIDESEAQLFIVQNYPDILSSKEKKKKKTYERIIMEDDKIDETMLKKKSNYLDYTLYFLQICTCLFIFITIL